MVGKPININDLCQMDPLPFLSMAKNIFIMKRINNPVAGPEFLKGGFSFSLTKKPAQFELKTKKKKRSSTFILLSRQYFTFITG